jgi:hypothetical protein
MTRDDNARALCIGNCQLGTLIRSDLFFDIQSACFSLRAISSNHALLGLFFRGGFALFIRKYGHGSFDTRFVSRSSQIIPRFRRIAVPKYSSASTHKSWPV